MGCVTSSGTKVRRKWNDGGCCLEDGLREFFFLAGPEFRDDFSWV